MNSVTPLRTMSAIRVAITLCSEPYFKNELLKGPAIEYDVRDFKDKFYCERYVKEIILSKSDNLKRVLALPQQLYENVMQFMTQVAKEMLRWCRYNSAKYGLHQNFGVNFLNGPLFTCEGKLNNEKAIEDIVKNESVSVSQRFKLACGYMMLNEISDLWTQMSVEERNVILAYEGSIPSHSSRLPNIWSGYLQGVLEINLPFWKNAFQQASYDLNPIAVRRCWDSLPLHIRDRLLIDVAHKQYNEIIQNRSSEMCDILLSEKCYFHMICVLLSIMSEEVKQLFLKEINEKQNVSPLLKFLMRYHLEDDLFFQILKLAWECLSPNRRLDILEEIIQEIAWSRIFFCHNNKSAIEKLCHVLKGLWLQSPIDFRKCVLNEMGSSCLYSVINFDILMMIIMNILTSEEKLIVVFSDVMKNDNFGLFLAALKRNNVDVARWLVEQSGLTEPSRRQQLKKELHHFAFTLHPSKCSNYSAVYRLAEWCLESDDEMNDFKRKWITEKGKKICFMLWIAYGRKPVDVLLHWCFNTEERIMDFKKEFFDSSGANLHCELIARGRLRPQNECHADDEQLSTESFYSWFGLTEKEILKLKGESVCTCICSTAVDVHMKIVFTGRPLVKMCV